MNTIKKEIPRYGGISNAKAGSHKLFHLIQSDFPGISFESETAGKLRLDQNDGTDVPLDQIPNTLTGKDADTVDGVHLPGSIANILTDHDKAQHDELEIDADTTDGIHLPATIADLLTDHDKAQHDKLNINADSVDNYHLDQGVKKADTPQFVGLTLSSLAAAGRILFTNAQGALSQDPNINWDNTNKRLGLGTTSPQNKLDIDGSLVVRGLAAASSGKVLRISYDTGSDMAELLSYSYSAPVGYKPLNIRGNPTNFSAGKVGIGDSAPTAYLTINSDTVRLKIPKTIPYSDDPGNQGDICWDTNYLYVCIATNSWKRVALTTFAGGPK